MNNAAVSLEDSPEERLWKAVLLQAAIDYHGNYKNYYIKRYKEDAVWFIENKDSGFPEICFILGIEPSSLRKKIISTPLKRIQPVRHIRASVTKKCAACGEEKFTADFYLQRNGYLLSYCRPCMSKKHKEYQQKRKEKT